MEHALYQRHLQTLLQRFQKALIQFNLDAIVIATGGLSHYYEDDNAHPFKPYAAAQQWLPFTLPANSFVIIQAEQPELIWPAKQDFWHAPNPIPEGEWQSEWKISPVLNNDWQHRLPQQSALIGPVTLEKVSQHEALKSWLNFERAVKTDYEIACLTQASMIAAAGHIAAEQAFKQGASELEIHLAYLAATHQDAVNTPYPNIIGVNENAAVLHYEHKSHLRSLRPLTLLVDAGALHLGYASDITRTTTILNDDFSALVSGLDELQQRIAEQAIVGKSFIELHQQTLTGVAQLLHDHDLCSLSIEEQLQKQIPHHFYPHGLGHLLGLQVHDVGGRQISANGDLQMPPEDSPFLRLTRPLSENMVLTIEPGLYFIPMLLEKLQAEVPQHGCNMSKIQALLPYGGIRIEDNIVVGKSKIQNLTRMAFLQHQ